MALEVKRQTQIPVAPKVAEKSAEKPSQEDESLEAMLAESLALDLEDVRTTAQPQMNTEKAKDARPKVESEAQPERKRPQLRGPELKEPKQAQQQAKLGNSDSAELDLLQSLEEAVGSAAQKGGSQTCLMDGKARIISRVRGLMWLQSDRLCAVR